MDKLINFLHERVIRMGASTSTGKKRARFYFHWRLDGRNSLGSRVNFLSSALKIETAFGKIATPLDRKWIVWVRRVSVGSVRYI